MHKCVSIKAQQQWYKFGKVNILYQPHKPDHNTDHSLITSISIKFIFIKCDSLKTKYICSKNVQVVNKSWSVIDITTDDTYL